MRQLLCGALLAVVAASCAAAPGAAGSASGDEGAIRETKDRAEIEALMWRYVRALDTNDPEAYAATYTPDGQFGSGPNATKGREALTKMLADMRQGRIDAEAKGETRPSMYHVITNPHVEFIDADHVRYQAYWMTVFGAAGAGTPPRVAAAGREVDDLVRMNGKWLLQVRNVAPTD